MCHTRTVTYTTCQHSYAHTERCLSKRYVFLSCLFKCHPTTQTRIQYGLCHDCRRYWTTRGIHEADVARMYFSCRRVLEWDGPLEAGTVLGADGEETIHAGRRAADPSDWKPKVRRSSPIQGCGRASSMGSDVTLWPGGKWEWEGDRKGGGVVEGNCLRGRSRQRNANWMSEEVMMAE